MWMIKFPAMALERVPESVPYEGGTILKDAVSNAVMPRVFFTNKGVLPSESEKVRKYAGVYVAGRERGTSFAFGYVAESYVDFGKPLMFLPILLFGCLLGVADRLIRRILVDPDVVNAVRVVVLWSSAYAYEQSWAIMIGTTLSLFVVMVGVGMAFDRLIRRSSAIRGPEPAVPARPRGRAIAPSAERASPPA
jgi:hypothetical protein